MKFMLTIAALILSISLAAPAVAAQYPERTINIINPFLPAGWMDLALRPVIEELTKSLGVAVITTPTPGAGGSIGHMKAATAKPDGYTLLLSIHNTLLANAMLRDVKYSQDTFVPIAAFAAASSGLVVKDGDDRFKSVKDFVDHAKANPGKVSMGIPGTKNTPAVAAALFEQKAGIKLNWVPFNGAVAVSSSVSSGHIDCGVMQNLVSSGTHPLLLFGKSMDTLPGVTTAKQAGYDIEWTDFLIVYGPKGLSEDKRKLLEKAILEAATRPAVLETLQRLGISSALLTGEEVQRATDINRALLAGLIESGFITPEAKN